MHQDVRWFGYVFGALKARYRYRDMFSITEERQTVASNRHYIRCMIPYSKIFLLCLCALVIYMAGSTGSAYSQTVVAKVNDEPITALDVAQRQRYLALTSGFGDKMKAALGSEATKNKFREMMIAANPRSQAEAQQVSEVIKKKLIESVKERVIGDAGSRKSALEGLVDDKLKLQAAKRLGVTVTEAEVLENVALRAGGGQVNKAKVQDFYTYFATNGVNQQTIQNVVRVQLAWRDVIRRQFGPQIASVVASVATPAKAEDDDTVHFEVRILKLGVSSATDQQAVSRRMIEAETMSRNFKSCKELPKQATLLTDASVKTVEKATLTSVPKEVQPLLRQASVGQMTPPVLVGNAVESYAVCRKGSSSKVKPKAEEKPDARQAEYERFSKRYLQELRRTAEIDMKGS